MVVLRDALRRVLNAEYSIPIRRCCGGAAIRCDFRHRSVAAAPGRLSRAWGVAHDGECDRLGLQGIPAFAEPSPCLQSCI